MDILELFPEVSTPTMYNSCVLERLSRVKNIQGKNCQEVVKQTYVQSTLEKS